MSVARMCTSGASGTAYTSSYAEVLEDGWLSQGLLFIEGEDTDTLYNFRIPTCTGFFKFGKS
jgi:hypothetical protein